MSKLSIYTATGWLTHLGPQLVINDNLEKRDFIVKQVRRKNGKYLVSHFHFTAQNDVIERLNQCLPGMEVTVRFLVSARPWFKDGVIQIRDGLPKLFQELKALDVFVMDENKKVSTEKIWKVMHWDNVNGDDVPESSDNPKEDDRKKRYPDHKAYDAEKFSAAKDYSDGDEGDKPPF